jgi:pilus assembly protein CpaC
MWKVISLIFFCIPVWAGEIWLRVGESRTISAGPEAVVRIGSRGVIRAVDTESGLRVIGLKPGATSLAVDGVSHMVRVSFSSQKEFLLELRRVMKPMMGLKLYSDEKSIQVRGTLLRFSDWLRIADAASSYSGEYRFQAQALPDVAQTALAHFTALARKRALPVVRFSAAPRFAVHIPKAASSLKSEVSRAFASYGMDVEVSESRLAVQPLVRTRVVLAEVSKGYAENFGVSWPSEYGAQLLPRGGTPESLIVKLHALESQGFAQILASPVLLCRSGGEAEFLAGGEFPIRMISRSTREVTWKQHGVLLKVRPHADFNGAISLEIETEVSLIDMANSVDGVPALKKNSVKSHFDLAGKRTVAISGLLRQELGRSQEGLPLLSGLPILGALFSSRNFQNRQSELVVFVTPEIYTPESDEPIEMPEGWVKRGF